MKRLREMFIKDLPHINIKIFQGTVTNWKIIDIDVENSFRIIKENKA